MSLRKAKAHGVLAYFVSQGVIWLLVLMPIWQFQEIYGSAVRMQV